MVDEPPAMPADRYWEDPPAVPALSRDQVHVWAVSLGPDPTELQRLEETLSMDERERAGRFHFERDHKRFIAARGRLRAILGRYLDEDPRRVEFCYGPRGKPSLAPPFTAGGLKFNLSHSGSLALIAVTCAREIGVDLEMIHDLPDAERIAERFFSPRETQVLSSLPEANRLEAFFACWTRKEAYVKATGDGLARPTESFEVSFAPGEPACLLSVADDREEATRWRMAGLAPAPDYVGAVLVEGDGWNLFCWRAWPEE